MNAFILTMFWLYVLGLVVSATFLASNHPRERETMSVGDDCLKVIWHVAFMAWAAYLLWGTK